MTKPLSASRIRRQRQRASARRARMFWDIGAPLAFMFVPLVSLAAGVTFAFVGF